uniref:Ras-GEF domain-containing protein n=1 Tax=Arcella intermedia TaxID=1963864 RepID=A0A6B2KYD9_9EUKA
MKNKVWTATKLDLSTQSTGTIEEIIKTMTERDSDKFFKTIISTYQSFTTPEDLLAGIVARFYPPSEESAATQQVKLSSAMVLKYWLKSQFDDFDENLVKGLHSVIGKEGTQEIFKNILPILDQKVKSSTFFKPHLPELEIPLPLSLSSPHEIILHSSPQIIAEQLALISSENFVKIQNRELLNQNWSKPKFQYLSPNVLSTIKRTDKISFWVATTILLTGNNEKQRADVIRKFIKIAEYVFELKDFHSLMGIVVGLSTSSINRLKKSWALLEEEETSIFKELETLVSPQSSFKCYREKLTRVEPPCVPTLAVYLSDLTFIDEGNNDLVDNKINIAKKELIYKVISKVQLYQTNTYPIRRLEPLYNYLNVLPRQDEKTLYKISLLVEPRGVDAPLTNSSPASLKEKKGEKSIRKSFLRKASYSFNDKEKPDKAKKAKSTKLDTGAMLCSIDSDSDTEDRRDESPAPASGKKPDFESSTSEMDTTSETHDWNMKLTSSPDLSASKKRPVRLQTTLRSPTAWKGSLSHRDSLESDTPMPNLPKLPALPIGFHLPELVQSSPLPLPSSLITPKPLNETFSSSSPIPATEATQPDIPIPKHLPPPPPTRPKQKTEYSMFSQVPVDSEEFELFVGSLKTNMAKMQLVGLYKVLLAFKGPVESGAENMKKLNETVLSIKKTYGMLLPIVCSFEEHQLITALFKKAESEVTVESDWEVLNRVSANIQDTLQLDYSNFSKK